MAKNKIEIKNFDISKIDIDGNLDGMSFEDSIELAEKLSSEIHSGKLDVAKTQKSYIFANRLLNHAKSTLDELSLTLEVVGEDNNQLKEIIFNGASSLFTKITECVKRKDLGGVKVLLDAFANEVVKDCERVISKERS